MEVIEKIKDFFVKDDIGEPPWEYDFLVNLDESEYPKYLKKIFKYRTGKTLNLKHPKTFNEKIQWLKLYDATPLKRDLTDKVRVRDYVREKIGEEYLKPVLQICNSFEEIDFDKLPNAFVMKCNHGCKWQYIIKKKEEYLNTPKLMEITKRQMTGWLEQEFWPWEGFEMQYKGIEPKILIEPLLLDDININTREIEIYCFNGIPKIYVNVKYENGRQICYYDENFNYSDLILHPDGKNVIIKTPADNLLKQSVMLSKTLSKGFKLARVDWMIYQNKLYFSELTFTPYAGLISFDSKWGKKLGKLIEI